MTFYDILKIIGDNFKWQKDISDIDHKIINMYATGLTTRQISDHIIASATKHCN